MNIEKLQAGCPKMKILRVTNSKIRPAAVPMKEQVLLFRPFILISCSPPRNYAKQKRTRENNCTKVM